ncbi:hypothetical protein CCHR01_18731 [Colletotrichum chrysophilum]|uniref:Uncharacterized protein n=1 Tax=Colletotrichum chrysophilum TaxID=1836956 RepID=A0AAD9E5S2_9PEZI|nr:hypothetical protein CCHR01_18731 [Colletotrichum chrysophilum]
MAKRLENSQAQTTTASAPAVSGVHSQPRFTALTAWQGSERVRIPLRLSQDLIYLKIAWNTLPSNYGFSSFDEYNPYMDPFFPFRDGNGDPKNIAIELAPSLLNFDTVSVECKWEALSGLINAWLELGISVWIVSRPEGTEPPVFDKAYTSRTTVFRDSSNLGYITVPFEIYLRDVDFSKCLKLADRQLHRIGADFPAPLIGEYLSRPGLLLLQEDLKFC